MKLPRIFCMGFQYKQVCWNEMEINIETQKSRALGKRVIPCLSMNECSIASATALQHEEYSIIPAGQDMCFVTEWIYNFLILSPLFYLLAGSFQIFLSERNTSKTNQPCEEPWEPNNPPLGFWLPRIIWQQKKSRRMDKFEIRCFLYFFQRKYFQETGVAHVRALWKDPVTLRMLQEVQKRINMCLSVLALLLLCLTVMTRWCVCHIQDD